ncbi:tyrosine-protein phosphatase [Caldibacillus lycopersici]|uniref:Tyrosine-protein phosphatase n=1 Tax=Perspicuibacillus lycopersici TaxID=1325689 RepID=A0AAE3IUG8_9BACI|nr:tyrosine-protein phosphatase [Perspicuibacillus lycopersici]MCU9614855.1 tyrosine-protein phosphatase [Perspicuibacillus lycopersici]
MKNVLQVVPLEGCVNFRDLGGYMTKNGERVKSGMLFRSGNLSELTEADRSLLQQMGIQKILDLRGFDEIEKFPDPKINDCTWHHTPLFADGSELAQVDSDSSFADILRRTKPGELLLKKNQDMVTYKTSFQQIFQLLLDTPDSPTLFHCMAGKDRTGAIAALILAVLGVPRETIVEDYLYTNEVVDQLNAHFDRIGYNDLPNVEQAVIDALMEARKEYIDAFLDGIEITFGGIENYSKEVLNLSTEEITLLKQHLLEK